MIPSGGDDVTRALMQRLDLSTAQAEQLKAARGLGLTPPANELEHVGAEVVRGVAHELVNGIRNTLQYYVTLRPSQPLQAILLSGGGSQLPGLAQALGDTMRLQVVAPSVLGTFDVAKSAQKQGTLESHTVALGLAVGQAA
jgi:type IV pilus assembly protein PilM